MTQEYIIQINWYCPLYLSECLKRSVLAEYKVSTVNFRPFLSHQTCCHSYKWSPLPSIQAHQIPIGVSGSRVRFLWVPKLETLECIQNIFEVQFFEEKYVVLKRSSSGLILTQWERVQIAYLKCSVRIAKYKMGSEQVSANGLFQLISILDLQPSGPQEHKVHLSFGTCIFMSSFH